MKKHYYVGVVTCDGDTRLVTSIHNETKMARWKADEKPLKMSKTLAEDITYGLNMNLILAFVVTSYIEIDEQLGVKEVETV